MRAGCVAEAVITHFFLNGEMEPPIQDGPRFYQLTPVQGSGEDPMEMLARVEPPIPIDGTEITIVSLRARSQQLWDQHGEVLLEHGGAEVATVYVSAPDYEGFGFRISAVASFLHEEWIRGGYWRWFLDALGSYISREGNADAPEEQEEDGYQNLGGAVRVIRLRRELGSLSPGEIEDLEAIPGWSWTTDDRTNSP